MSESPRWVIWQLADNTWTVVTLHELRAPAEVEGFRPPLDRAFASRLARRLNQGFEVAHRELAHGRAEWRRERAAETIGPRN